MRSKAPLTGLNVGEVSPETLSRVDLPRIKSAFDLAYNIVPEVSGSFRTIRPGTIKKTTTRTGLKAKLLSFIARPDAMAILELTNETLRPIVDGSPVTRPAVSTVILETDFSAAGADWDDSLTQTGCTVTYPGTGAVLTGTTFNRATIYQDLTVALADYNVEHAVRVNISRRPVWMAIGTSTTDESYVRETLLRPGEHSIAFTPTGAAVNIRFSSSGFGEHVVDSAEIEAAGEVELTTEWVEADCSKVGGAQSADVLFVAADGYEPRRIERRSQRAWSIVREHYENPPISQETRANVRMSVDDITAREVTIESTRPYFSADHVGGYIQIEHYGQHVYEILAGERQYTQYIKVTGTGTLRYFTITISGLTGTGSTVNLARSVTPDAGFEGTTDVSWNYTTDQAGVTFNDALDNQTLYYRLQIKAGNYVAGTISCELKYVSGGVQKGCARITGYTSSTEVTADVVRPFSSTEPSDYWNMAHFNDVMGWPTGVDFYDGRLAYCIADRVVLSVSDDFTNFSLDVEGDSAAIIRSIGAGPVQGLLWLSSMQRLLVGSMINATSIRSSDFNTPLTRTNFIARPITSRGMARLKPQVLESAAVCMTRDFSRAIELQFDVDIGDYRPVDRTKYAPHIFLDDDGAQLDVVDIAVRRHPETRIYFVMSDGTMRVLTYDKDDDVYAWHRYVTNGVIESVTVLPGAQHSELWLAVKRTIDGSDQRFIESAARDVDANGGEVNVISDCSGVYDGVATTTITGADHLEGESIVVWADGKVVFDYDSPTTVSGGQFTLPAAASYVVYGLGYEGKWKFSKLAYGGQLGTALNQRKDAPRVGFVGHKICLGGLTFGHDFDEMRAIQPMRKGAAVATDEAQDYWEMDQVPVPARSDPDARLCGRMIAPYSGKISAVVVDVREHDK